MARIAIVHIGLAGHVARLRRLGQVLARQGHDVHAWAPEERRAELEAGGVVVHAHEPLPVRAIGGGQVGFAAQLVEATQAHAEPLIDALLRTEAELVFHDYLAIWGRVAAEFLGLPSVACHPLAPFAPGEPVAAVARPERPPLVPAFPPGWERAVARREAAGEAIRRRWGVELDRWEASRPGEEHWTASFTLPELALVAPGPDRWRYIGPLLDPPPSGVREPAHATGVPRPTGAAKRPLVYVSLGTFFNFVLEPLRAVVEALAGVAVDVVVSTGRGPISPDRVGALPDNVTVEEFVDARSVLGSASAFVTHCGANSVHEALIAGVPMVCLPQAADQFAWAARVQALGAGLAAREEPASVREAVQTVLDDPEPGARARELGELLATFGGDVATARLVEDTLAAG